MTISSLCLKNGLKYGELTTYVTLLIVIYLLCLQIYNKRFIILILSSIIVMFIFYNNEPITYYGGIAKKEEIFSLIQLGNTKREIIIKEDTYAAVYAAADIGEKSIVCILGTGSNCTYFDAILFLPS